MFSTAPGDRSGVRYQPVYLLIVLTLTNAVNWADRQVVPVLFSSIARDLHLTDTQLGMIGGVAFSAVYAVAAFVFGYFADYGNRRDLIAVGLTLWTLATAASGVAVGFGTLFAARFFTGIGEASLYPCAMSLFAEKYPPESQGRAMGIFGAAAAVGGGIGVGLGGYLAETMGWRFVFFVYGASGLGLIPLLATIPEEKRVFKAGDRENSFVVVWRLFRDIRLMSLWMSGMVMIASGIAYAAWAPSYFERYRGYGESEAGLLAGAAVLVGGLAGSLLGGYFADRRKAARLAGELDVSAVAALVAAPLVYLALWAEGDVQFAVCGVLAPVAIFSFFPSIQTVMMRIVPQKNLGTAYAVQILFMGGVGTSFGPFLVGAYSDSIGDLRSALMLPVFGSLLASVMALGSQFLIRRHPQ